MAPWTLYTVCLLGALGLYLLVRPMGRTGLGAGTIGGLGAILGIGALGYLMMVAGEAIGGPDAEERPGMLYLLFSAIAVIGAVRMISTTRPVYSALYFVLVVLSSAALFLLLAAEFMAFALIIVYAGAILITYLFVLMLAQQSPDPDHPEGRSEYDLNPREPFAGAFVGFLMLALLASMIFNGAGSLPSPPTPLEQREQAVAELAAMPRRIREYLPDEVGEDDTIGWPDEASPVALDEEGEPVLRYTTAEGDRRVAALAPEALPENVQAVGLGLVKDFPVSLELAGVILLMAMFGAVILARRQIELTEDEKREAAGMRRMGIHDEPATPEGEAG
jgi:NADH-quinone oxidoreductase subunit J